MPPSNGKPRTKTPRRHDEPVQVTARAQEMASSGDTQYWLCVAGFELFDMLRGHISRPVAEQVIAHLHRAWHEGTAEYAARLADVKPQRPKVR